MWGSFDNFMPFSNYAVNYFVLIDPGLHSAARYNELKGMIEAFSFKSRRTFTLFPNASSFESYKKDLLDFLLKGTCKLELIELANRSHASIVVVSWVFEEDDDESEHDDDRDKKLSPVLDLPMEVVCVPIDELFDESKASSIDILKILKELFIEDTDRVRGKNRIEEIAQALSKEVQHDYIMIKPNLFGFGIDLNALARRFFRHP